MAQPSLPVRLLDTKGAAVYLGIAPCTVRDWNKAGILPNVELPALRPREGARPRQRFKRLLFDVRDLDAFVDALKQGRASVTAQRQDSDFVGSPKKGMGRGGAR